jgi:hypothetical protein
MMGPECAVPDTMLGPLSLGHGSQDRDIFLEIINSNIGGGLGINAKVPALVA